MTADTALAFIRWLDAPEGGERSQVGGKAANLSRLAALHRVPPGFTVTAHAFDTARAARPADAPLAAPPALRAEIAAAYAALSRRAGVAAASVAVRSSAVDEDGSVTSFAGQHETYLNVVGPESIVTAVEACWASTLAERALAYRRQRGLGVDAVGLAVLVQLLVPADVAGVAFGANPLTHCVDEVIVNASWGLGESIVGGTVAPDSYVLRKGDLAVLRRDVATKTRMTILAPRGTAEVAVPRLLQQRPVLDDAQAVRVATLARDLEVALGWPVDLEFAFHDDTLYLLQCRPITTLGADKEMPHDDA